MIHDFRLLTIVLCLLGLSCASSKKTNQTTDVLPATALQPYGRFIIDKDQGLELISSAMHFGFSFEGTECQVFASIQNAIDHNYLQYELDGVYQKRIRISGNARQSIVLTAPNARR